VSDPAPAVERITDRAVLLMISSGLIVIILAIIVGIFITPRALPNWAENVLVSIGTAAALKLGDCLATLVALSSGKSVERLGTQLGNALPVGGEAIPVKVDNAPTDPVPVEPAP
jgi:hypothetical protein